jgi:hypothetical protein
VLAYLQVYLLSFKKLLSLLLLITFSIAYSETSALQTSADVDQDEIDSLSLHVYLTPGYYNGAVAFLDGWLGGGVPHQFWGQMGATPAEDLWGFLFGSRLMLSVYNVYKPSNIGGRFGYRYLGLYAHPHQSWFGGIYGHIGLQDRHWKERQTDQNGFSRCGEDRRLPYGLGFELGTLYHQATVHIRINSRIGQDRIPDYEEEAWGVGFRLSTYYCQNKGPWGRANFFGVGAYHCVNTVKDGTIADQEQAAWNLGLGIRWELPKTPHFSLEVKAVWDHRKPSQLLGLRYYIGLQLNPFDQAPTVTLRSRARDIPQAYECSYYQYQGPKLTEKKSSAEASSPAQSNELASSSMRSSRARQEIVCLCGASRAFACQASVPSSSSCVACNTFRHYCDFHGSRWYDCPASALPSLTISSQNIHGVNVNSAQPPLCWFPNPNLGALGQGESPPETPERIQDNMLYGVFRPPSPPL